VSEPPPPPVILPAAVYQPRLAPAALPRDLRLRSAEWGVLFALTGRHSVAQVAARLGLSRAQAAEAVRGLLAANLVVERRLDLVEYLRAAATTGDPQPRTFAELLSGAPLRPAAEPVAAPPERPAAVPAPAAARSATRTAAPVATARVAAAVDGRAPASPPPFRPLALENPAMMSTSPPQPSPGERALSLRALMRFIRGRATDETAGQLDVYRAFLLVDPELLKQHGITTLRFEDDRVVRDPELQGRILAGVEAALGVRCPEDVFV
jgi:hypothetical protein